MNGGLGVIFTYWKLCVYCLKWASVFFRVVAVIIKMKQQKVYGIFGRIYFIHIFGFSWYFGFGINN